MSREIKFRAWNGSEMVFCWFQTVYLPVPGNRNRFIQKWFSGYDDRHELLPNETPIMQYTGLKDKDGIEIYEGDIIELTCQCCRYVVEYRAPSFFPVDDGKSQRHKDDIDVWAHQCVIIGNIHQNPKLLEKT